MTTREIFGYAPSAIVIDAAAGTYRLVDGYDHARDRVRFAITDDDAFLDGDRSADEVGEDATQTGVVSRPDGTVIASGRLYAEDFVTITGPDGSWLWLDRIEIGGRLLGYIASAPMVPGVVYRLSGGGDVDDSANGDTRLQYAQAVSVPCFLRGTPVETESGECPVEHVRPGTRVLTRDHGWQPVLWTGHRTVRHAELVARPDLRPIRIAAGALGPGAPRVALRVSPLHHLLVSEPMCELFFGASQVLVAAGHMAGRPGIARAHPAGDVTYHHLLLARHEVILVAGAWAESLLDTDVALQGFGEDAARAARAALGPHSPQVAARPRLRRWEAEALFGPSRGDEAGRGAAALSA